MSVLLQDLRIGFRQLWKHPGFALTAILSLALGIAATVSVFSIVYSILLHPLPYTDPERIVEVYSHGKTGFEIPPYIWTDTLQAMRTSNIFDKVVEIDEDYLAETTGDIPQDVDVVSMAGTAFQFLGVPAMLGRTFLPSDAPEGKDPEPVVVLTHQYWLRRFNGNPAVVGQALRLDGRNYTILGVMPSRFTWWDADVYVPLNTSKASAFLAVMSLKPGVSRAAATAGIQPLMQRMAQDHPGLWMDNVTMEVRGIDEQYSRPLGRTLYLLFAGVGLLLAIGCGNVSILLLARGTGRRHEFAVRAAVGAAAWRIVRQLLTESLMIGIAGAALGVIATYRSTPFVVSLLPWQLFPRGLEIPVHIPVLGFSVLLAIFVSVLFGLVPALQLSKPEIREVMQSSTRKAAGSVAGKRLHSILISGQIALAMVLLTASAAAIQGFSKLTKSDLGYSPSHVADFGIPVHMGTYKNAETRSSYFMQLRDRVAETPGVTAASLALVAPPYSAWDFPFEMLGQPGSSESLANINVVDPNYFSLMQISLSSGRLWEAAEASQGARLAIVNRAFVRQYSPNRNVLGLSVRVPRLKNNPPSAVAKDGSDQWLSIIGVVGDARNDGLDKPVKPAIYVPYSLFMFDVTQILVKSQGNPMLLENDVRRQIARVNPGQQVSYPVTSLEERLAHQPEWSREHLIAVLSGTFSVLALVLASVGLFSVVSYSVAQRINEFGIRMALGAQRHHILLNVLSTAGASVGSGLVAGVALSLALHGVLARLIASSEDNLLVIPVVSLLLLGVALVACLVPALRATMVQPMKALRID